MNRIEIKDFSIKIDKDKVLKTLGCFEGSSVYETVSSYFDELEETVMNLLSPRAVAVTEDMKAYCILTVGEKISGISKSFFDNGEGMKGILVDAMADEYLFMMDDVLAENIKLLCAKKSWGVKKRFDAPKDFPLSQQSVIVAKTGVDGIKMTSGFMFEPVKTFGYILEFTTDEKVFNAQHDCSKCSNFDCPRRSNIKNGRFEVLSSYEYKPNFKEGDSAVCIDIGTTTVAFELVTDKGTLKTYRTINPQRRFGLDVLSRIESANRGRLDELSAVMRYTIISGYKKVTEEFGDTKKVVIAGNTTMVHLLMGYSCGTLGEYPFKSKHLGTLKTALDKVTKSKVSPIETVIYGGISAFVGGDIVSGLYMSDFDKSDKVNMFIDLGTNGEMALGNKDKMIVTSTAAGPAFEGAGLSCGMRGVAGAIDHVNWENGSWKVHVIGDREASTAEGICGSGVIDGVAGLLESGLLEDTGYLEEDVCFAGNVGLTAEDIREVQLAKGAIRAGMETLLAEEKIDAAGLEGLYVAGGFGSYMSAKSAERIGLFPKIDLSRIKICGNAALAGAVRILHDRRLEKEATALAERAKTINLGSSAKFQEFYMEYMMFDE